MFVWKESWHFFWQKIVHRACLPFPEESDRFLSPSQWTVFPHIFQGTGLWEGPIHFSRFVLRVHNCSKLFQSWSWSQEKKEKPFAKATCSFSSSFPLPFSFSFSFSFPFPFSFSFSLYLSLFLLLSVPVSFSFSYCCTFILKKTLGGTGSAINMLNPTQYKYDK